MGALQELVNIEERADVGGPRKQGDGQKLRWLVKLRRGDGKQVERKVRANTRQAIKNHYADDFISADPMDDETDDDLTEAKAVASNPAWLQNAPMAKMDKLAKLKLPDEVKRALAARLSNGEINDLLVALGK